MFEPKNKDVVKQVTLAFAVSSSEAALARFTGAGPSAELGAAAGEGGGGGGASLPVGPAARPSGSREGSPSSAHSPSGGAEQGPNLDFGCAAEEYRKMCIGLDVSKRCGDDQQRIAAQVRK